MAPALAANAALQQLWLAAGMDEDALQRVSLPGIEPVLP